MKKEYKCLECDHEFNEGEWESETDYHRTDTSPAEGSLYCDECGALIGNWSECYGIELNDNVEDVEDEDEYECFGECELCKDCY